MTCPANTSTHAPVAAVSPWIERFAHLIPAGGRVLDVACGAGRHVRYFAARAHPVLALDRDAQALAGLADVAQTLEVDLESPADPGSGWPLSDNERFSGVVVTNYLHRPLLGRIVAAVAPGGILLYETFAVGNETVGKPSSPAFLLRPGELLDAVAGQLRVLAYEDGFIDTPRPAHVQRLCAVREDGACSPMGTPARYPLFGIG